MSVAMENADDGTNDLHNRHLTEFFNGSKAMAPLIVAVIPIGALFGAAAVAKGLSALEATLMSALVFAGGSQFVAIDVWTSPPAWVALGLAALLVNVRHVLMSFSLAPKLEAFRGWRRYVAVLFLTDEGWAVAESHAARAKLTPLWFAGAVLPFYLAWVLSGLVGAVAGAFLGDPKAVGLDFAFCAVFIVLVMRFWKGPSTGLVLLASGGVAVAVHHLLPGVWYILAGALAGLAAAILAPAPEEATA
jgi:4-azaleucine resistance transporter AzlC